MAVQVVRTTGEEPRVDDDAAGLQTYELWELSDVIWYPPIPGSCSGYAPHLPSRWSARCSRPPSCLSPSPSTTSGNCIPRVTASKRVAPARGPGLVPVGQQWRGRILLQILLLLRKRGLLRACLLLR
ncbi:hypothetical protein GDO81_023117 [Engystomops pustulosus]|uniref:Uncharacterized protein n=1 Tax=Engystomops pustulosus TaxID=76066 RepID=A0AAV6YQ80_ENGPU|nr:hypothetical protein GDO81_023117 [Engystomops pustulosus]